MGVGACPTAGGGTADAGNGASVQSSAGTDPGATERVARSRAINASRRSAGDIGGGVVGSAGASRRRFSASVGVWAARDAPGTGSTGTVSYTHLRAHETVLDL